MPGLRSDLRCRAHEVHPIEREAGLPIRGDDEGRAGQLQKGLKRFAPLRLRARPPVCIAVCVAPPAPKTTPMVATAKVGRDNFGGGGTVFTSKTTGGAIYGCHRPVRRRITPMAVTPPGGFDVDYATEEKCRPAWGSGEKPWTRQSMPTGEQQREQVGSTAYECLL